MQFGIGSCHVLSPGGGNFWTKCDDIHGAGGESPAELARSFLEANGKSTVRLVTDNPNMTKTVLESEHASHTEAQVAQTTLPHRP